MDFGLTAEQRELVASFTGLLAKRSPPERVRDAEPGGVDEALWRALQDVGAVTMVVGAAHGGWGADLSDAVLVAEEVGRALAPAPVIEAQVAARLLADAGSAAADALADVLERDALVTMAVRPARNGTATLVPAGAVCDACVVLDGDRLVLARVDDTARRPVANLAHAPLADIDLTDAVELAAGPGAREMFEGAVDEWLVLTAASLVGIGAAAHDMACGYARERQAFGAPIGSFQGVSHPLADDATHLDGARLLARQAAWTLDRRGPRGCELAAMAFSFASRAVAAATYDAVHVHGGYGFMLEHDAQLFYRRARGWPRVWGDAEAADRRAASARCDAPGDGPLGDVEYDAATEAFRAEVLAFLAEHLTPELDDRLYTTGTYHDDDFVRALAARGWIAPEWERDDGTVPLDPVRVHVLTEELTKAEAPIVASATSVMVARVVRAIGSDWLKDLVVPAVLRGETTIALGLSEPEAGSDVAAVRTRARRDGDAWVVDGQKMFTTCGHIADHVFLLTRTDPESERHRGLTTFLVPLDSPGIEVQPVFTVSGERTNISFYSEVRLDDRWRIGEVGEGWQALMLAMQEEHSAPFSPHLDRFVSLVEEWAAEPDVTGARPLDRDEVRRRLVRAATDREVGRLLDARVSWMEAGGEPPVAEGPMTKLFNTEALVRAGEDLVALVGPDGLRTRGDDTAVLGGRIEQAMRYSIGATIQAGTSEIQRNIIANFRCRLPRR